MKRDDWIGIASSVLLHALLLFGLSFLTIGASEPVPLGFIEVEFGPFSEGRPVARAPATQPDRTPQPAEEEQPEEPAPTPAPAEAKPVDLPDEVAEDVERIPEPEADIVAPEEATETESEQDSEDPAASEPIRPLGSGDPEGTDDEQQGQDGSGTDETKSAPYQIEGLNRVPVAVVTPRYTSDVDAVITVQITVDPSGRVIGSLPLRKADARLEAAVGEALARWRFNPLPGQVPQQNQIGRVTFRFRRQ